MHVCVCIHTSFSGILVAQKGVLVAVIDGRVKQVCWVVGVRVVHLGSCCAFRFRSKDTSSKDTSSKDTSSKDTSRRAEEAKKDDGAQVH